MENTDELIQSNINEIHSEYGKDSHISRSFEAKIKEKKRIIKNPEELKKIVKEIRDTIHKDIQEQIATLKDDPKLKQAYYDNGFNLRTVARKINIKSTVSEIFGDIKFNFGDLTPEQRKVIEDKPFSFTNKESWQDIGLLLGEEFAGSIKDIALFFASIPGSSLMIPSYISLRNDRHKDIQNEAKLALMLEEFPGLALIDLATDWNKGATLLKEIGTKLVSGKQGDIAFLIINIMGLLAGGATLAGKAGSLTAKLSSNAAKITQKLASTTTGISQTVAKGATATAKITQKLSEKVAIGGNRVAQVAGSADTVLSGQLILNGAVNGAAKVATVNRGFSTIASIKNGNLVNMPKNLVGKYSPQEYATRIDNNAKLDPGARSIEGEKLLGVTFTEQQKIALENAHNTGTSGAGKWTQGELKAKYEIMEQGGFTRTQARMLLENGLAGKSTHGAPEGSSSPRVAVESTVPQLVLRDNLATALKKNRYENGSKGEKGIPNGKIELTTGESITITPEIIKPLEKDYTEAMKIEPESARSAKLAELDTQFAERLILDNGRKIEVGTRENAQKIVDGLGSTPGYKNLQIIREPNGNFSVSRTPKERTNNLEKLSKFEKGIKSSRPESSSVVESPVSIQSAEFTQAFVNGLRRNYRVSLNPDGSPHVMVENSGKFVDATEANGGIPGGQAKKSFDVRIANEAKDLNLPGKDPINSTHSDTVINGNQGVSKEEKIRNIMNNPGEKKLWLLDTLGLPGWKVQKLPQGSAKSNSLYELTIPGKEPIRVEGSGNLEKRITSESKSLAETTPVKESPIGSQPKEPIIPQNESRSELKQLQDRRDEILAWKKENPGNIRHDADLMVTETAIAKIDSGIQKPENLTGNQGNDRTPSQSATTDKSARDRIEREHGLDGSRDRLKQSDILGGSFRTEMEAIMKMDDATFQKNYTEVQYRKGNEGNRPHEVEMYEAAANIRKLSDADIIANADTYITANRQAMGQNRQKALTDVQKSSINTSISKTERDIANMKEELGNMEKSTGNYKNTEPHTEIINQQKANIAQAEKHLAGLKDNLKSESLPVSDKARIVAENAALRSRLKDIIGKQDPELATVADDPAALATALKDPEKSKKWWLLGLIPLALLLTYCNSKDKNPQLVPPTLANSSTLVAAQDYCQSCYSGSMSTLNKKRIINGREANDTYRLGVSDRWVKTPDWKNLVKQYKKNQAAIKQQNPTMATAMDDLIGTHGKITVDRVQKIQHCIAMLDRLSSRDPRTSLDSQSSQDGMLGPITTQALRDYFTKCI